MSLDETRENERLRRELKQMAAERDRLLAENRRLAEHLKSHAEPNAPEPSGIARGNSPQETVVGQASTLRSVNSDSTRVENVQLFRSLFTGREDVYARFWQSKQSGKSGYSPVCVHEWDRKYCQKPSVKCGDCPNRDYAQLTDHVVQDHLDGKLTVGIYPLLKDDTSHFLAIDFDKHSWTEDSGAFLETCKTLGIPAYLERSRSGNGAHVWIFFSESVAASEVRKLGCCLLTETMSRRHQLAMDSYDRLFPNQDSVPKGGFGNLIALPLQKGPSDKGNTLFLDSHFEPHRDQWEFLSTIERMTAVDLERIVRNAIRAEQVMGACISPTDDEEHPWEAQPSRRPRETSLTGSLPKRVNVVVSNLVYVEKKELPSSALNRIKRLAVFQNPDFYKRQRLRLSTSLTPRMICCAEEFPHHLAIPRGCLEGLKELLENAGVQVDVADQRFRGTEIEVAFRGELSPAQETAVSELQRHDSGVLVAPSGSGKTVAGIHMIAARKTNTLVLVHRRPLMEQWRAQLSRFLGLDEEMIGQIGGGKERRTGLIDVAMLQSLGRKGEIDDLVAEYGQIIVDECHHLPAVTFEQVLRQAKARYVLGLTATPYRRDGQQAIILMQCGQVRHIMGQQSGPSERLPSHLLICRETPFVMPARDVEPSIHDIYAALIADEPRNQQIVEDVVKSLDEGRSPILLTERREHLDLLEERLSKRVPNVVVLRGGMGTRERRAAAERLASVPNGERRVLLATGRYIGEGFDDPRLDTLFLAMPVSWKGTLVQYAGRLHRPYAGKTEARIYDYVDRNCRVLMGMFHKRLRGYRSMGYEQMEAKNQAKAGSEYHRIGESAISMPLIWDEPDRDWRLK